MSDLKKELRTYNKMAQRKHDSIIASLESRLLNGSTNYTIIKKEDSYYNSNLKCAGECDLHAMFYFRENKYLLCFEVKATNRKGNRHKAVKQLYKDIDYYSRIFHQTRVFKFYVYGKENDYVIQWLNRPPKTGLLPKLE